MPYTTPDLVSEIIEVDLNDVPNIMPFILTAAEIVEERCEPLGYTEDRLELIERWLAAHFYSVRDPRLASEGVSGVSVSYQQSSYLDQAKMLDTLGGLANLGVPQVKPSLTWLGRR